MEYRVLRGLSYPADAIIRGHIRRGTMRSSEVEEKDWARHEVGEVVELAEDLIAPYLEMAAIEPKLKPKLEGAGEEERDGEASASGSPADEGTR